jgi:hypothetical protein
MTQSLRRLNSFVLDAEKLGFRRLKFANGIPGRHFIANMSFLLSSGYYFGGGHLADRIRIGRLSEIPGMLRG